MARLDHRAAEDHRAVDQPDGPWRQCLEHLKGGAWHPFRRKWATERKDLPLVDVKATGGWRDTNTLLTCYQQTDEASMLRVMSAPSKLRSVGQAEQRNYVKTTVGG
jgi:hypothetical protein